VGPIYGLDVLVRQLLSSSRIRTPGCSVRGLGSILVTLFEQSQANLLPERTQACSLKENFSEIDS